MIIDWYTIIFQIVNFLVLVFLLRHFLYGPIIKAMDDREEKIMEREETAAKTRQEAEEEARAYRERKAELEQQEREIREEAHEEAEKEKREMLNEARREVEQSRRRWEEALEREKDTFLSELRRRVARQACQVARRCLEDLADARLEELTWNLFSKKLKNLPEKEEADLQDALAADQYKVTLQSAFEPAEEKLNDVKLALQAYISDSEAVIKLTATKDQDLLCGLELNTGGYRIAWNIDSYLDEVEEEILKSLDNKVPTESSGEVPAGEENGS